MLTIKRLDLIDARKLIGCARDKAKELDVPVCIAVTDESGNLIAFERMDGSKITSVNLAIDKSYTAAGIKKGTHVLSDASLPGNAVYGIDSTLGGRMVVIPGGLPVLFDGETVGGVGVSSGTPIQDLEIAKAAVTGFSDFQS